MQSAIYVTGVFSIAMLTALFVSTGGDNVNAKVVAENEIIIANKMQENERFYAAQEAHKRATEAAKGNFQTWLNSAKNGLANLINKPAIEPQEIKPLGDLPNTLPRVNQQNITIALPANNFNKSIDTNKQKPHKYDAFLNQKSPPIMSKGDYAEHIANKDEIAIRAAIQGHY